MTSGISTFDEAVKHLKIEDFSDRILNSNSRGELFHIVDYITIANNIKEEDTEAFSKAFRANVKHAEDVWERPESVFQHINKMFG